ncbi:hypothetical protein AAMO2058_001177600 [Amorphochlora amoebiformis]
MMAVPVFNQVRVLVANLSKKTFKGINLELKDLVKIYGEDARIFFLRCLLDEIDFTDHKFAKDHLKIQLVNQELSEIIAKPNFVSLICRAIDTSKFIDLPHFTKVLKLPLGHQISIALAFASGDDRKTTSEGKKFLLQKLPELNDTNQVSKPPEPILHELACFLQTQKELPEEKKEQYLKSLYPEFKNKLHIHALMDKVPSNQQDQRIDGKSLLESVTPQISLSSTMSDLGPSCLESKETFKKVLAQFPRIQPEDIAQAIGMMAQTSRGLESVEKGYTDLVKALEMNPNAVKLSELDGAKLNKWNTKVFVDVLRERYPRHIWQDAYLKFDHPGFFLADQKGLKLLVDIYSQSTSNASTLPLAPFLREWKNKVGQLSFIRQAVEIPGFFSTSNRIQGPIEGFSESRPMSNWWSLDLLECLLGLGNTDLHNDVWEVLRKGLLQEPEMMLCGALQLRHKMGTPIAEELLSILTPQVFWEFPKSKAILQHLFTKQAEFVVDRMIQLYVKDGSFIGKILDIVHQLRRFEQVLETRHHKFAIELASLASEKKLFNPEAWNLETWLKTSIAKIKEPFVTACLEHLRVICSREKGTESSGLTPEATIFFNCLFESTNNMSQASAHKLQRLYTSSGRATGTKTDANSADIEREAHLYFKQIYEGKISLTEVVETLKKFKVSSKPREVEMFACMIHALFDEYRFFSQYPEKELRITGVLFGLLIKHRLVYRTTLGIALRYVLDALQKAQNSSVFQFGMWALEQFKERLHQWPQYCALIVKIPHLRTAYPELVAYIERAANGDTSGPGGEKSAAGGVNGQVTGIEKVPSVDASLKWQAEQAAKVAVGISNGVQADTKKSPALPPESIRDKIHFLINNLSRANIEDKVGELREFLESPNYGYFSHFLVTRRVVQEANHLMMYATFVTKLGNKKVHKIIVEDTYGSIKSKINSDKLVASFDERKVLKNLGSWLGLMTLAQNRPILAKKLRLKELLMEAYRDGRLIAIIPFVKKVLEPTTESKIFKPPNPWLMALLSLLREIMEVENLKLNLKFAIECLFNHLKIEVNDVQPTSLLSGRPVHVGNLKPVDPPETTPPTRPVPDPEPPRPPQPKIQPPPQDVKDQEANLQFVKIHPSIPLFKQYPDLKRNVPIAVDKAIQDILPVVERSVQIACVTARQLIMKDFSMEQNHNTIRQAAHQMVRKLTSSLALVTCKEPLRLSISSNLAARLEESLNAVDSPLPDRNMLEVACVQVSNDNLELGCKLVEKAASDRAVYDIDEHLVAFYTQKKQGHYPSNFPADLPDSLKPKANGMLTPTQMRVYEDFGATKFHTEIKAAPLKGEEIPSGRSPMDKQTQEPGQTTNQQVLDSLLNAYYNLKKAIMAYPDAKDTPLTSLPQTQKAQEIHKLISLFPSMIRAAREDNLLPREVMYLSFANRVFKELFNEPTALMISSQCAVLKCIIAAYPVAIDRTSEWLLAGDEPDRKFVKRVTTALIGNHLVDPRYIDEYLKKSLVTNITSHGERTPARLRELERTIDLSITLVRELVVKEQVLPAESFRGIIEVLLRLPKAVSGPFDRSIQMLFEGLASLRPENSQGHHDPKHETKSELQRFKVHDLPAPLEDPEQQGLRQRVCYLLDDWLTICLEGKVSDKMYAQYLTILRQQELLQTTKRTNLFFRLVTELCIEAAYNPKSQSQSLSYTTIDALAKLVVFLVKFLDNANKIALLSSFLQVAAHVLIRDHDSKKEFKGMNEFNQKPYLRLFTNLLYDLNTPDPSLDSSNIEVLNAFSHCFHTIRPARVPAFAFAWMELIAHRMFMPKLLISKPYRCSVMFKTLIVDQLTFLYPYLQNAELLDQVRLLYKGTLRILLVLLHDFPEFLCEFHFDFCDVIPTTCIQMRNLILSAFPRNVRLPDPLTPNLKVDLLPEIMHPPRIGCDVKEALIHHSVLQPLEQYLASRQPTSFPAKLCEKLQSQSEAKTGSKYDVPLINALVLHLGMQGIAKLQAKNDEGIVSQFQDNSCMDIFERLVVNLDPEGRYYVLNAIANQLRYPNNHTHYFSCVLLYLFLQNEDRFIKEQITRVLLERLIVHQPHPWGLLITFIELIKNPQYDFTRQPFTHCAPEIARLFESVARSCMPAKEETNSAMPYIDKEKLGGRQ